MEMGIMCLIWELYIWEANSLASSLFLDCTQGHCLDFCISYVPQVDFITTSLASFLLNEIASSYVNMHNYLRYERFVFALEEASRDMLPILKDKALKVSLLN